MTTRAAPSSLLLPGLFVVPVAEIPAVPDVPIAPSASVVARHCSSMGAQKAAEGRNAFWVAMLGLYATAPRTDAEIAAILSDPPVRVIPPSTISARRAELIAMGKVDKESCGTRKNQKTGVSNSLWQLATKK